MQIRSAGVVGALLAACLCAVAGCGGQSGATSAATTHARAAAAGGAAATSATPVVPGSSTTATVPAPRPVPPPLVVHAPAVLTADWAVVARVHGQPAAWAAERGGVALMRFDQRLTRLDLHAGSAEPGGSGWPHGPEIDAGEIHHLIAGFNGGFKLSYGSVGFLAGGRVAVPLSDGLASIVTYTDGTTQIGAWHAGVPASGVGIESVRQNLHLLIDHGAAPGTVEICGSACWGATLGGGSEVARSALGIDAEGRLVWAGGESLTPSSLASALTAVGAQRAVELDINPFWVAGYLYVHHPPGPTAVPVVPGQHGIAGQLLEPDARDFFAVVAR